MSQATMQSFEVIVSVWSEKAKDKVTAVAEASRYLASGDGTETFGHPARVFDVDVYGGEDFDWGIALKFDTPIQDDKHLKAFMEQMRILTHVETVERI